VALEARVAWDGQSLGRRVVEVAGGGSGRWCRVGKNEIVVKARGVPDGLFFPGEGQATGGGLVPGASRGGFPGGPG
jgi:hypothetical protein